MDARHAPPRRAGVPSPVIREETEKTEMRETPAAGDEETLGEAMGAE